MITAPINTANTALLLLDLQNDFLHPDGAYGRAGQVADAIATVPQRLAPLVVQARAAGMAIISSHFTLVPGPDGAPLISPHLKQLRPFLGRDDFRPGAWGHAIVDALAPSGYQIEKIAYSAFYMTRLEWILRKLGIEQLITAGIVTNGGVASTVRDAHVRDFRIILAEDGCAAFTSDLHDTAIASLRPVAQIASISDIMQKLETTPRE